MYNKAILMGRITHDLELKTTPNSVSVCHFQIAVDRRYQVKGEERKTDFFKVTVWRQTAEFVTHYFKKGSLILVEGELQNDNYTDKSGNTVNSTELVADRVSFTGEKKDDVQSGNYGAASNYGGAAQPSPAGYAANVAAPQAAPAPMPQTVPQNVPQAAPVAQGAPSAPPADDNYPF